ncbi:hypothetical protein F4818DRAFT_454681 [Hypoxylon cercidicola]|nr:hypothetical protein F4818DRAFT_454681 [Hypoxylon cercidicola]
MSLSLGDASEQDPDMVDWLAHKSTILIDFGSGFTWMEPKEAAMASALAHIWRFRKDTKDSFDNWNGGLDYDDAFLKPLQPFIDGGRVKMYPWLSVDPTARLKTGHIVVSIHHGGSGCYHEAIESDEPQLVLP